jgi:hypothetical protein
MPQDHHVQRYFTFTKNLLTIGRHIFTRLMPSEEDPSDVKILAILLLCRTIGNLNGTILLAQGGLVVEARTIVRCCFENLFFVNALHQQGEKFVKEMFHDELASLRSRGEFLLQQRNRLPNPEWEPRLREMLRDIKNQKPIRPTLDPKNVAGRGPAINFYTFYSELSTDAAHPTGKALSRYITWSEDNGKSVRGIDVEPPPSGSDLADTLHLICSATLGVFVSVREMLGSTTTIPELTKALDEYKTLKRITP